MIAAFLMSRFDWDAIWFLNSPGGMGPMRFRWWRFCTANGVFVGTWTGPQLDLICVRRCETNQEAERWLSPAGYTFLDATLRAAWRYYFPRKVPRHA